MSDFERLGGDGAIAAVIDAFYARILADETIAPWFIGVDLGRLKEHLRAFLAVALGGPELYDGRSMRIAHGGRGVTNEAYSAWVEHLSDVFVEIGVARGIADHTIARIELMRVAIVEVR